MTSLTGADPRFVDAHAVPVVDHLSFPCRTLLAGRDTGGALGLVEERGRIGCATPRHVHAREAETFVVLDGALQGWCDGRLHTVEAGSLLHLAAGRENAFRVASETAHFYTIITPVGFESFFTATGTPVAVPFDGELPMPGPVPPAAAAALQAALTPLGVTITGPPPFDDAG